MINCLLRQINCIKSNSILLTHVRINSKTQPNYFKIYPKEISKTEMEIDSTQLKAILPLGWQLSEPALRRLKKSISRKDEKEREGLLKRFGPEMDSTSMVVQK